MTCSKKVFACLFVLTNKTEQHHVDFLLNAVLSNALAEIGPRSYIQVEYTQDIDGECLSYFQLDYHVDLPSVYGNFAPLTINILLRWRASSAKRASPPTGEL